MTIHSGLVKCTGRKTYHSYVSDVCVHDQVLTRVAIDEVLSSTPDIAHLPIIVIESDNCSAQHKSGQHFCDSQYIANTTSTRPCAR